MLTAICGNGGESSDAHRPIPLKGMGDAGYVMYLSTFSKTVTSGLRTGWVVADPHVINRLAALRRMVDQHTSIVIAAHLPGTALKKAASPNICAVWLRLTAFDEMQQSQHWSGMRRMNVMDRACRRLLYLGFLTGRRALSGCIGILPFPRRHVHAGQRVRR